MPVPTSFRNGVFSANDERRAGLLLEDTFKRNACPPPGILRRLACETGHPIEYIENWFEEKRKTLSTTATRAMRIPNGQNITTMQINQTMPPARPTRPVHQPVQLAQRFNGNSSEVRITPPPPILEDLPTTVPTPPEPQEQIHTTSPINGSLSPLVPVSPAQPLPDPFASFSDILNQVVATPSTPESPNYSFDTGSTARSFTPIPGQNQNEVMTPPPLPNWPESQRPATPAQQPRPNQLATQVPGIQNEVRNMAPSPVRAVTPRILPTVPYHLPGSPSHVRVRTKVGGREFTVKEGPSGHNLKNGRMVFYPKIVNLTLPEPKLVYPEFLFNQFLNKRDQEITDEEEATFHKVLLAKMTCQICSQGLVTLRCVECCNTICNNCVVGLAHAKEPHIAHRIQCPYCRHQVKPFVPLSLLR